MSIKEFTVPHPLRRPDGAGLVGCMDRRLVSPNDPVLGNDRLFQQIRGGRFGLSGLAIAIEVHNPNRFINWGVDLAQFSQAVGTLLQMKGLILTKHGPKCGAIEGALSIHQGVTQNSGDAARQTVYDKARDFKPDLSEKVYEATIEAHGRINTNNLTVTPERVKQVLETPMATLWAPPGELRTPSPTQHVELVETNHDEVFFAVDYREGIALNRAAAHEEGYGAYYSSFGAFEEILELMPDEIKKSVDLETWWNVEATILGEIATNHIVQDNGMSYRTEVIGR